MKFYCPRCNKGVKEPVEQCSECGYDSTEYILDLAERGMIK